MNNNWIANQLAIEQANTKTRLVVALVLIALGWIALM